MIIAGTAVGAGMFSLPIAMSGIWFGWSVAVFLLTWFCMLLSGMMILEANLNYPVGSSFSTITRDLLGPGTPPATPGPGYAQVQGWFSRPAGGADSSGRPR